MRKLKHREGKGLIQVLGLVNGKAWTGIQVCLTPGPLTATMRWWLPTMAFEPMKNNRHVAISYSGLASLQLIVKGGCMGTVGRSTSWFFSWSVSQFIGQSTPSSEGLRERCQGKVGQRNMVRRTCGPQSRGPEYGESSGLITKA